MILLDRFIDLFCDKAAVVNDDPTALQKEVKMLKKRFGPWYQICGFKNFKDFFLALHMARVKHCKDFSCAFIRNTEPPEGELILKKINPDIKTYKYSDTQQLSVLLADR